VGENTVEKAFKAYSSIFGFTIALNTFYFFFKGGSSKMPDWLKMSKTGSNAGPIGYGVLLSCGIGLVCAAALQFVPVGHVTVPALRKRLAAKRAAGDFESKKVVDDLDVLKVVGEPSEIDVLKKQNAKMRKTLKLDEHGDPLPSAFCTGLFAPIDEDTEDMEHVQRLVDNKVDYHPETEWVFQSLQVFTACVDSLGHGANDVANSIGPLAAVVAIYLDHDIQKKVPVPLWITAVGGAGIVFGLALYGRNILRALGVELITMSPSRGFTIELGAAFVIVGGSMAGIPLSTTHCQVGAETFVGMVDGCSTGVSWRFLAKIAFGWVFTLIFVGLLSALLFSFAVYSPTMAGFEGVRVYTISMDATIVNTTLASMASNAKIGASSGFTSCALKVL
jgi:phosphate/sulfate permease